MSKRWLMISFFWMALQTGLHAQSSCGAASIDAAEGFYNIGRFKECIGGLTACLESKNGFNFDQKISALRLLAMSYLAIDSTAKGDEYISQLLLNKDNFESDARDPERFRLRVLYTRLQMRANLISSVSKKAEKIELAPATIQIVTAEDIFKRGYQDVESIFNDLPGFDIARTFGISYTTLYQRGYRSGAGTERTLILVDGVEDNEIWSNTAVISKQYPISNIKRVEVIYGPASTIYGANAFVGVINIVTKGETDYFPLNKDFSTNRQNKFSMHGNAGYGTYNSRYADVSAALRNDNVFFTITGRVYKSDEVDLSKYPDWDGKVSFDTALYRTNFTQNYTAALAAQYALLDPTGMYHTVQGSRIVPTTAAILKADSLDKTVYSSNQSASRYSNPTNDYYIASKLRIGDFRIGFQYWNRNEGAASDYVDRFAAVSDQYTNWQIRQYYVDVDYSKSLSNRLSISSLTFFRSSDFSDGARITQYLNYGNKNLSFTDLLKNTSPNFLTTHNSQQSNQFRSELRVNYLISQKIDMVAGAEFRNGILQGDYVKTTNNPPALSNGVVTDSLKGGNNYSSYTIGAFVQMNYQDKVNKININLGGRFDNNTLRLTQGYGSVFNPRVAFIYYPSAFVFKAIYSEAFLDASSFNKFSVSTSRSLNNPTLQPERVKNIEFSARYFINKRSNIEVSFFKAYYSGIIGTAIVTLPNGSTTGQFQALGKAEIQGMQVSAEASLRDNITLYANLSVMDPKNIFASKLSGGDSAVRSGDIANYSFNAGVNFSLLKDVLNLNLRTNVVGNRPTGKSTSINTNPYDNIDGFALFNGTVSAKLSKRISIQYICNNIFDTEYYSPGIRAADGKQYAARVPQQMRNMYIRIVANIIK
jgi:outer membrane receptor for ferrienterochelin and colicins